MENSVCYYFHSRITTIPCAFNLTATTIPCGSQKRFQGLYYVTFSRSERCLLSLASGSLTAVATISHAAVKQQQQQTTNFIPLI